MNSKQKIRHVYLFIGEEELLKEEALNKLKKQCLPSDNESSFAFNYISFDGESVTSKQVIAEAQQLPFMSAKRLIIVKDAGHLIDETLLDYIQNPVDTACLALLMRKIDKRLSSYKILKDNAKIVEFSHLRQEDLVEWIQNYVSKHGKSISYNDTVYITNILENNLSGILQELEKLIAYIGSRSNITVKDINLNVSENKIKNSFELTDAIQRKNASLAIGLVNNLLNQGKSLPEIIGLVRWMLTRLWQGKDLIKENRRKDISKELRIPYFFIAKFTDQAERFTIPELKKGLNTLLNMEKLMRTYSVPPHLLLECLVIQLSQ